MKFFSTPYNRRDKEFGIKTILEKFLFLSMVTVAFQLPLAAAENKLPNIVIFLADDAGYADLSCYGSAKIKTPNLDAFAKEGARFTTFYAGNCVCSPSRGGLMTGREPARLGIFDYIPGGSEMRLHTEEDTLGKLAKRHGYDTGFFGKWALTGKFVDGNKSDPDHHGFDYYLASQNNAKPSQLNPEGFYRNGKPAGTLQGYSAQVVVDEAEKWLDGRKNKDNPFMLLLWFQEPHLPLAEPESFMQMYAGEKKENALYYGNVSHMDYQIGRMLKHLEEKGLVDQSFVFFSSDNGPREGGAGSAEPYRGKKASLYEGGIIEPAIIRWPGVTKPGSEISTPLGFVDVMPTLREILGETSPPPKKLDGTSFLSVLRGSGDIKRDQPLFWESFKTAAMRDGDYKIHVTFENFTSNREPMDYFKKRVVVSYELFNLKNDPTETTDLKDKEPEVGKRLLAQFEKIHLSVQEDMPYLTSKNFLPPSTAGAMGLPRVKKGQTKKTVDE
jgi:arylsulfatase A